MQGLFDESIAAHAEARRLDPNIVTSVQQTLMMNGSISTGSLAADSAGPRSRAATTASA